MIIWKLNIKYDTLSKLFCFFSDMVNPQPKFFLFLFNVEIINIFIFKT